LIAPAHISAQRHGNRTAWIGCLCRVTALLSLVLLSTEAFGRGSVCGSFRRNLLGSWSALRPVAIPGPYGQVSVRRGMTFNRGVYYQGLDLVALLEQRCRRGSSSPTEAVARGRLCGSFRRNLLGSWSAVRPLTTPGPYGYVSVRRGTTFNRGVYYHGLDLVALLEQDCR
jgi:hypothetical protein